MEKQLFDDGIISLEETYDKDTHLSPETQIYSNKSLIQLEATLLEMAAYPQLCKGVMYMFHIPLQGKHVVR